jgi:predicted HicB family RNase H-like nuclease
MTKKTDAQSLLSSFNRAPEVPRAQTAAPGNSTARVGRVNVGIRSDLHDQVRVTAFEERTSVQAVVERALEEYFKNH